MSRVVPEAVVLLGPSNPLDQPVAACVLRRTSYARLSHALPIREGVMILDTEHQTSKAHPIMAAVIAAVLYQVPG